MLRFGRFRSMVLHNVRIGLASALLLAGCGYVATPGEPLREDTQIGKLAKSCAKVRYCGGIGYADCGAELDGPAYYFERRSGRVLAYCGGSCMSGECRNCPPRAWSCGRRGL
jgi:hypothetical protein